MGAVYLFHDLYGYLMEMSPDIAAMIEAFDDGVDTEETIKYYQGKMGDADPRQFVDILAGHAVLVDPAENELEGIWAFVPIKARWTVWQRRDTRLTLWTAWGDKPVQQLFLDEEETKIWDAFDGTKRLIEMRHHFDNAKIEGLVRKLVHSDVQALKLSVMPWAAYEKRPSTAPAYLSSTMPYARWKVGDPVAPAPDLLAYHQDTIQEADAQFDHQETTLSHLLRVQHPALHGKTYGQALVAALDAKQAFPAEGPIRILEIGAGLGYVARDVIATLKEKGREVAYTIVELSPALAKAQQERIGTAATWHVANALEVTLPEASFDIVISNEMVGDLPASQHSREDIGLSIDGTGNADLAKLRALGPGQALYADLGMNIDDATEPFYLQTGAVQLVARIARWLAPNGTAVVTEFGQVGQWPKLSTQLDHPELSTHFGHLLQAARAAGLHANVDFIIDLLDFDRTLQGLATTRSYFRALQALAESAGVELPKLGYTPDLLAKAVGDKLDLSTVGDLRWDRIEDRLMGLVPHEFKALVAKRVAL